MKDLLQQLQQALRGDPEKPPKGFFTSKEWAKKLGVSLPTTQRLLNIGVKKGIMKMQKVRIMKRKFGLYPVSHYAEKK